MKLCNYKYDVIFISYDEPNADENWEHLKSIVLHARRVHGVKGIDKAHKEAAKISKTDRFYVIDGDTKLNEDFFNQEIEISNPNYVYSWSAENVVNGLIYGNGGTKLWPKHLMKNLKSHEVNGETDFCWTVPYYQINSISSKTVINSTSYQAFRAGFREGTRLSLDQGKRTNNPRTDVWEGNYHRLLAWTNIGADVENGLWAMLGARMGCWYTCLGKFDIISISDYDFLYERWKSVDEKMLGTTLTYYGNVLRRSLSMPVITLENEAIDFARTILYNPVREGLMLPELGEEEYLKKMGFWKD